MRKEYFILLVLPFTLLLTGCPYRSPVPLSETPKLSVDKALLGTWVVDGKLDKDIDSVEVRICSFSEKEYYIEMLEVSKTKIKIDRHRGFVSVLGKDMIMNMEDIDSKGSYLFFQYKVKGDKLDISIVSDVAVKQVYTSSKAMAKAFAGIVGSKDFYETPLKLVRKSK